MFKKEDAKEPSYLSVLLSNKTSNQRSGVSNEKQLKEFVLETDFPKLGTIKPQADQRLTKKNTRVLIDCDLDVLHYLNRISNIDSEEPARILFRKNINLKTLLYLISNQSAINRYLVDIELYELLVSLRSHGWARESSVETQFKLQQEWDVTDFDSLYTFYYPGYNVRSTDLQAYIGLTQIDKLNDWGELRESNYESYQELIDNDYWKPKYNMKNFTSNFAYPIIHPKRDDIVKNLQDSDIETRPMVCGSMGTQPFYVKKYGRLELPNVTTVDKYGFYVPNHPKLTESEIKFVCEKINEVINND